MKSIHSWLEEYAQSHKDKTNIKVHWICIPIIFWCITGFMFLITIPLLGNLAVPVLFLLTIYYALLSRTLWVGMLLLSLICLLASFLVYQRYYNNSFWLYLLLFIVAWIGQFYGHKVEGKKPSFLKDIQFLLIGPAFLMSKLYKTLGIPL